MKNNKTILPAKKDIIEYNILFAQTWKIYSKKNLLKYEEDFENFAYILHSLVGKQSSVLRTVPSESFNDFAHYIYNNLKNIKNGTLDIFDTPTYNTKTPYSFVSKICHIINPKDYPVIYDSHTKQCFGISMYMHKDKIKNIWNAEVEKIKKQNIDKVTDEDLYKIDSEMWASLTK